MQNNFESKRSGNSERYVQKYLPEYIHDKNYTSTFYQILKKMKLGLVKEVRGLETLSKGEKLFISRHNTGDDIWKLMVALDEKVHIVGSETIHWKDKLLFGIKQKAMKQLEMLPIKESFSQAQIDDKKEFLRRVPFLERRAHKNILNRPPKEMSGNLKYICWIIAILLDGQNVIRARMDLAVKKQCDGIESDNVDGYSNKTGFKITAQDQLHYNK